MLVETEQEIAFHIEPQKGTNDQAIVHCKKGDQPTAEWKSLGKKGFNYGHNANIMKRGEKPKDPKDGGDMEEDRWGKAWASAVDGDWDSIPADIKLRQYNTIKRMMFDFQKVPLSQEKLDFHWWWDAGKSRAAREENPHAYLKCINKWWDNYAGEDCVIIDEWEPCHECLAAHLKRWCDHHPFACGMSLHGCCIPGSSLSG